jgi:hypothetical protein
MVPRYDMGRRIFRDKGATLVIGVACGAAIGYFLSTRKKKRRTAEVIDGEVVPDFIARMPKVVTSTN